MASVFRVLRNMLQTEFPPNSAKIAADCTVQMAICNSLCLPHVIDFMKFAAIAKTERLCHEIILNLVDCYDDIDEAIIENYIEYLIPFFIEASAYPYEFCQPRVSPYLREFHSFVF